MNENKYLDYVLSLYDENSQQFILRSAYFNNNNVIDTGMLSTVFYAKALFPRVVESNLRHSDYIKMVEKYQLSESLNNSIDTIDTKDIRVSEECCNWIDKLLKYEDMVSTDINVTTKKNSLIAYMTYLFLTDMSFVAHNILKNSISTQNLNKIIYALHETIIKSFNMPTGDSFNSYGRFLTDPLSNNSDRCIGRDNEILKVVDILSRKKKNNPILVGQPGVGKTAIVEGLANLIMSENCPPQFKGYHIFEVSLSALLSGTKYRGDFEGRLQNLLHDVINNRNVILFIDEIHNIMSGKDNTTGEGMNASEILKPYMSKSYLMLIGATTEKEYRIIEKDRALERRFSAVHIKELDNDSTSYLLSECLKDYSEHFNININKDLVTDIIYYADMYIANRYMPDKALDILDNACVYCVNHSDRNELSVVDIISATESIAGISIPEKQYTTTESGNIAVNNEIYTILNHLKTCIVGQDNAIKLLSKAVSKYYLGLKSKGKPIASFLFVGPTGVGKTQLCKELANVMFTNESFIRLDMSEYMEKHSVAKLIGSPPGYVGYNEGGKLTEAVKHNPHSVILFDEIEKAHPDIFNILLQILDDGILTDSANCTVKFNNCIIIMTSNIGAKEVEKLVFNSIGFISNININTGYEKAVKDYFSPEFINRLDKIVCFNTLSQFDISQIVDIELSKLFKKYEEHNISLSICDTVRESLYKKCYSKEYGARFVQRIVSDDIEDIVIDYLVQNNIIISSEKIDLVIKESSLGNIICEHRSTVLV